MAKNCEEYVLNKLEELEEENYELKRFIGDLIELLIKQGIAVPESTDTLVS